MADEQEQPFSFTMPLPRAIHRFENLIWGRFSVRDAVAVALVATVAAVASRLVPGVAAQIVVAFSIAIPGLVLSLYHLVSDAERIEIVMKRQVAWLRDLHDLTWKKEYEDGGGYTMDTTQSVFKRFTVNEHGHLMFDRAAGGGGAALLSVEGSDYVMQRGGDQRSLIGNWLNFLDGIAEGEGIPFQIVMKSMPLDLTAELEAAAERRDAMPEGSPLRYAMDNYITYLDVWQGDGTLFEKRYYLVIPYLPGREGVGRASLGFGVGVAGEQLRANNPLSKFLKRKQSAAMQELDLSTEAQNFDPATTTRILNSRVETVRSLLSGVEGLTVERARLEEYVELMYYFFNPSDSKMKYVLETGVRQNLATRSADGESVRRDMNPQAAAAPAVSSGVMPADLAALLSGPRQ